MPDIYGVKFNFNSALTPASFDIAEVVPGSGKPLVFLGFTIFQISDLGDASEKIAGLALYSGNTSAGSGGSAVTPANKNIGGGAASFTAAMGNTTIASGGTAVERGRWGWNVRMEKELMLSEQEQIYIPANTTRVVFKALAALGDPVTGYGELFLMEM